MNDKKKIILTGGHLAPLLAVYEALKNKVDISVIGRKYTFEADKTESLEYDIFKKEPISFYDIQAPRLQRKYSKDTIPSFFKSPAAIFKAGHILKDEKPDAVVVFGGYIGLPVAIAAYMKKIPIIVHEQTLTAGLANRIISKMATKVCISFPESEEYFNKKKIVLTGNPVRQEIFQIESEFDFKAKKPLLYITGGSTGAHAINVIVSTMLPMLLERFNIIHQTGDAQEFMDLQMLSVKREELPEEMQNQYILRKFILPSEIGWIYKNAEVVLSRAGINTITELLALSKKALLIPLSHGQKNEQLKNAKMYVSFGLGEYILEESVTPEKIITALQNLLEKKVAQRLEVKNDAAEKIADVILNLV